MPSLRQFVNPSIRQFGLLIADEILYLTNAFGGGRRANVDEPKEGKGAEAGP